MIRAIMSAHYTGMGPVALTGTGLARGAGLSGLLALSFFGQLCFQRRGVLVRQLLHGSTATFVTCWTRGVLCATNTGCCTQHEGIQQLEDQEFQRVP